MLIFYAQASSLMRWFVFQKTRFKKLALIRGLTVFAGLLDSLGNSDEIEAGKWSQSEDLLDCPNADSPQDRKLSPPFMAVLSESRIRSGSDPSISKNPPIDHTKKGGLCSRSQESSVTSPKSSELFVFVHKGH